MLRIAIDTKECGELVASRHGIDSPLMPGDTVGITWADGAAADRGEVRRVILNRPFVYMLIDCESALPFFIGTMTDPAA